MCRGLLIRGGDILEAAASIDTVAFDKTGTLTVGKPSIAALSVTVQPPQPGHPDRQLLAHAAALERQSTHPLASAVLAAAAAAGKTLLYMPTQLAALLLRLTPILAIMSFSLQCRRCRLDPSC